MADELTRAEVCETLLNYLDTDTIRCVIFNLWHSRKARVANFSEASMRTQHPR